ncbi:MAG: dUTP diphosphatase [Paracoccaceae bacterium]|jgi:dUTP pyrophosphatase
MVEVQFTWSEGADQTLGAPCYETEGAAGADIRANLPPDLRATGMILKANNRLLVPTGLRVAIPPGFEVQLRPRSGLALKHGITLLNAPGTVDSDYRGEIGVILYNSGSQAFLIAHGDRIAQLVVAPVIQARFVNVDELAGSERNAGGFGSTGRS